MEEAKASWNTCYQSKEGFECRFTLRDENETNLAERAKAVMASVVRSGGMPLKRRTNGNNGSNGNQNGTSKEETTSSTPEKTYVDEKGVRRCNLKLKNGAVCNQPVTERQGRYGSFWSCPDYKEHVA